MKSPRLVLTTLLVLITLTLAAHAQEHNLERGLWHASSKSAKTITGDVVFTDFKFTLDFFSYPLANIRTLTPAEIAAAFSSDPASATAGTLYRLSIPSSKTFLRGHPLCSGEETQWIATHLSGKSLEIVLFSGSSMPILTPDALTNTANSCGLYTYTR